MRALLCSCLVALTAAACGGEDVPVTTSTVLLTLEGGAASRALPEQILSEVAVWHEPSDPSVGVPGWQVLLEGPFAFDGETVAGGVLELGDADLPEGRITQVRLTFADDPRPAIVMGRAELEAGGQVVVRLGLGASPRADRPTFRMLR
ncbi:MAG: hypothetical protein H6704_20040 [Myxococcales bacterium]|nr:hypothetical protein [Myxococcales bacterium]